MLTLTLLCNFCPHYISEIVFSKVFSDLNAFCPLTSFHPLWFWYSFLTLWTLLPSWKLPSNVTCTALALCLLFTAVSLGSSSSVLFCYSFLFCFVIYSASVIDVTSAWLQLPTWFLNACHAQPPNQLPLHSSVCISDMATFLGSEAWNCSGILTPPFSFSACLLLAMTPFYILPPWNIISTSSKLFFLIICVVPV